MIERKTENDLDSRDSQDGAPVLELVLVGMATIVVGTVIVLMLWR